MSVEEQIEAYLIGQALKGAEFYEPPNGKREMLPTRHIAKELGLDPDVTVQILHRLDHSKRVDRQWVGTEYHWQASWRILPRATGVPQSDNLKYGCPKCGTTLKAKFKDKARYCWVCHNSEKAESDWKKTVLGIAYELSPNGETFMISQILSTLEERGFQNIPAYGIISRIVSGFQFDNLVWVHWDNDRTVYRMTHPKRK